MDVRFFKSRDDYLLGDPIEFAMEASTLSFCLWEEEAGFSRDRVARLGIEEGETQL